MTNSGSVNRGAPLVMFALVIGSWVGARAVFWESPLPTISAGLPTMNAKPVGPIAAVQPPARLTGPALFQPGETMRRARNRSVGFMASEQDSLEMILPMRVRPTERVARTDNVVETSDSLPVVGLKPNDTAAKQSLGGQLSRIPTAPRLSAGEPARRPVDRWSLDAWAFWREGSNSAPVSQGRVPIYGASQAGANLQYRLAPSSRNDPRIFARAYRALVSGGESELAVGASARPLGSLPVRIAAEARITDGSFGTDVRPAVLAITELAPQALPARFQLETYGAAGYVGGDGATPFVDGQTSITREVAAFDGPTKTRARLSFGAGAWGGAQKGSGRLDVGPTVRLDLTLGDVPARVSVDWRQRVAGDAEPGSGIAATLSTRF